MESTEGKKRNLETVPFQWTREFQVRRMKKGAGTCLDFSAASRHGQVTYENAAEEVDGPRRRVLGASRFPSSPALSLVVFVSSLVS